MTQKYRYIGPGMFPNVPAQDITAEEFERMPADQRRIVLHSGVYEAAKPAKKEPEKNADTKNDAGTSAGDTDKNGGA